MSLFTKIFGDYSTRELKRIYPVRDRTLALEDEMRSLSDEQLKAKTDEFKQRLADGATLDDILPEAFAVCREASDRVLGMRHFPVQIVGGIVLHQGRIAEMRTGEGKTLVATLPAYLNALTGRGVHIVTVNDYLAKRDSEWMGKLYRFLGLSVGLIIHEKTGEERRAAYACDITYGTNNEMGFDYLRDNMVQYKEQRVQRGHNFGIVDEVDSILIDEARTPLIISGMGDKSSEMYKHADSFVRTLVVKRFDEIDPKADQDELAKDCDYIVDEKARTSVLTKNGIAKAEQAFGVENLMDAENVTLLHYIDEAIKAHGVMKRDVNYIVKDGQVLIVDEFTGRVMPGRRYNEGLHQAIEAKEGVEIKQESKTLATITFQNYFRLYEKLSGMTGTAMTEQDEFREIYSLDVVAIPTNKPMIRVDHDDVMYNNERAKFAAVINQIRECHEKGQPVLVGTISIDKSELLSKALHRAGIKHEVLNAKQHEREAEIIAQAGKLGSVTIATNMAGRGTDIILGGNAEYLAKAQMRKTGYDDDMISEASGFADTDDEDILAARKIYAELIARFKEGLAEEADKVREAGGLFIIGTNRHEARRIDNQLRGRSGRQGDPGESRFYLAADDDLMRQFAGDRFKNTLAMLKNPDDTPIEAGIFTKAVESAQKRVEANNFAIRKNVLQYDDVMNRQRELIYSQRNQVIDGEDLTAVIDKMINDTFTAEVDFYCPADSKSADWNKGGLLTKYPYLFTGFDLDGCSDRNEILDRMLGTAGRILESREQQYGKELMDKLRQLILLRNVDMRWMDHIDAMDDLKSGIGLRAYAQKDPVVAFREESFDMFEQMTDGIREGTVVGMLTTVIRSEKDTERKSSAKITGTNAGGDDTVKKQPVKKSKKPGRNDPCPCGSGLKYKKCHGRNEE
ncbi:MAG: preprotein translocase subunit SecA [Clostridia bacterium]|nr:preprotein translocase subunit SecA [Clostridia bacterium]